jgi:hypothetical protein
MILRSHYGVKQIACHKFSLCDAIGGGHAGYGFSEFIKILKRGGEIRGNGLIHNYEFIVPGAGQGRRGDIQKANNYNNILMTGGEKNKGCPGRTAFSRSALET